jgi:hypothetical protein
MLAAPEDRGAGEVPVLLQERTAAVSRAQHRVDGRWRQALVMGGVEPAVDILRAQVRQLVGEAPLQGGREMPGETLARIEGRLPGGGGIMPCRQEPPILSHQLPAPWAEAL